MAVRHDCEDLFVRASAEGTFRRLAIARVCPPRSLSREVLRYVVRYLLGSPLVAPTGAKRNDQLGIPPAFVPYSLRSFQLGPLWPAARYSDGTKAQDRTVDFNAPGKASYPCDGRTFPQRSGAPVGSEQPRLYEDLSPRALSGIHYT